MSKYNVLVTAEHLVQEAVDMLKTSHCSVEFMAEPINEETLIRRLSKSGVDAVLLRGSKPFTAQVLSAAKGLKIIAKNGAGVDSVDLSAAQGCGVRVAVAPGANAGAVAEHAIAMMLSLVRSLPFLDQRLRAGGWEGTSWLGRDFRGSVLGIVGLGSIGLATAKLAKALGAKVLVWSAGRPRRVHTEFEGEFAFEDDFSAFLSQIDILSLHCPLTDQTRGMIGEREFSLMKKGSFVINTARGAILDESALIHALKSGHIAAAGLDTFEHEPLPSDHLLRSMPQVMLSPHVAGVTKNAALQVARITAQNIIDTLEGRSIANANWVAGPN